MAENANGVIMNGKCPYCDLMCAFKDVLCFKCRMSPTQDFDMMLETIQLEKEIKNFKFAEDKNG